MVKDRALLVAAAWLVVLLAIARFPRNVGGASIDAAWQAMLADGYARRWSEGIDLVFTYGPYGWVHAGTYLPGLLDTAVGLELAAKGLMAVFLVRAACEPLPGAHRALFLLLVVGGGREDGLVVLAILLVFRTLLAGAARPRAIELAGAALLAYLALVKFTFLVAAGVAVGLVVLNRMRRGGSLIPVLAFALVATFAFTAGWTHAGGRLAQVPRWLNGCAEVARGYPPSAARDDRSPAELALALPLVLLGPLWGWRERGEPAEQALLELFLAFLVFKHGFVRHDAYHVASFWTYFTLRPLLSPGRGALPLALVGLAALATCRDLPAAARCPWDNARYLASMSTVRAGFAVQWQVYARELAFPELARVVGDASIDVLPAAEQTRLVLGGLNFRPRPVFSCDAATLALLEANARYFDSARAPRFVLLAAGSIDRRYPEMDDSLARREVQRLYRPVEQVRGYLLLERRAAPDPEPPREVRDEATIGFGQTHDLSGRGRGWLAASIRPSLAGRLLALLYKPPAVWMTTGREPGAETYRVLPAVLEAGFPLEGAPITFTVEHGWSWCFEPEIHLTFSGPPVTTDRRR